jgi:hypothetical protein
MNLLRDTKVARSRAPPRTRDHAGLQQFQTVKEAGELVATTGPERGCAALIPEAYGLFDRLAVDFCGGVRQC